ncbi:unnamed protein product, partial [Scytosiphon promiscuus]
LGAGLFIDSVRRKTHPHVWILNTPVVYLVHRGQDLVRHSGQVRKRNRQKHG